MISDASLDRLKSDHPCPEVASKWVSLRKRGHKFVGPCPVCSKDRSSRSAGRFEANSHSWVCAVCADGGDVIRLVERVEGLDFKGAVDWLGGVRECDPAETARREKERSERDAARERNAHIYRERERHNLYDIWNRALAPAGTDVEAYLVKRHLALPPSASNRLRCVPQMPYFAHGGKGAAVIHRGPAMVAPIVRPDGMFAGLHFTWIDLAQPDGKAALLDPETGEMQPAKKIRGSKAGCAIKLVEAKPVKRLIVGEGLETVLSVWTALSTLGRDLSGTAFWSAIDLGNLSGRAGLTVSHPTLKDARGRPRRVPGPDPDINSAAIAVPNDVQEVILLGDGDSDPIITRHALCRAQTRLKMWHPDRIVRAVWAPPGRDFNDVLRGVAA